MLNSSRRRSWIVFGNAFAFLRDAFVFTAPPVGANDGEYGLIRTRFVVDGRVPSTFTVSPDTGARLAVTLGFKELTTIAAIHQRLRMELTLEVLSFCPLITRASKNGS